MSQAPLGDRRGEEVHVRGRWQGLLRVRSEISHYAAQKRDLHKATENKGWEEGKSASGVRYNNIKDQGEKERVTWPRAQTKMTAGTRRVDRGSQ
jgi:hypothetical protein